MTGGKCMPIGNSDCGNGSTCGPGYICSRGGGCIPQDAADCGQGHYCTSGTVCSGTTQCISQEEAARRQVVAKVEQIVKFLGVKEGLIASDYEQRKQRAIEYVIDSPEVQAAIMDLITTRAATAIYGPAGDKAASVMLNIKGALEEMKEFKSGHYYQGSLDLTNQVSSILLEALPYGGASADVLNAAGAITTSYVYGFFWGT